MEVRSISILSRGRALLAIELREGLAGRCEPCQQGRGRPELPMLLLELANAFVDFLETHGVGVPHGPAARSREPIAVDVNDVDIARPQGDALFEDARSFVD